MRLLTKLIQHLLPPTCVLCKDLSHTSQDLCQACLADLPFIHNACSQCGCPLDTLTDSALICGNCLKYPPFYQHTLALFRYQLPIAKLIIDLKFHEKLLYARLFSQLFIERIPNFYAQRQMDLPHIIIPMPLHAKRLHQRGFNQALEIAKPIAKKFQLPLEIRACQRIRHTAAQSLLPAAQRRQNVKGAFQIAKNFCAKHVAIVDDVITTGHTVNEFSHSLRMAGVEKITVWSCARTLAR